MKTHPKLNKVNAPQICTCGHPRTAHAPRLPAPCRHGLTMPDAEIIARACDPTLPEDPRYGCRCVGFCPATS